MTKSLIRLIALGLILATSIASGLWFWLGTLLALLVMLGMAGATRRPALPWVGLLTLLMWVLLHVRAVNPAVGWVVLTLSGSLFVGLWMLGTGRPIRRPRRASPPAAPLRRTPRAG